MAIGHYSEALMDHYSKEDQGSGKKVKKQSGKGKETQGRVPLEIDGRLGGGPSGGNTPGENTVIDPFTGRPIVIPTEQSEVSPGSKENQGLNISKTGKIQGPGLMPKVGNSELIAQLQESQKP